MEFSHRGKMHTSKVKTEIKRINGYLKEVVTFLDDSGQPISHTINPLMIELKPRDIAQIFVGSLLVATPLCLTEEVWNISETLPMANMYYILGCSVFAVMLFVYFNFYRFKLKGNILNYVKRIMAIYIISLSSVVLVLFLVGKFPIETSTIVAIKRVVLIGFPAIIGATITDYLK